MNNVNILGIEISDISKQEALARVRSFMNSEFQHYIVTPNPEIVLQSHKDHNLRYILNQADLSLPDGFGLKISAKLLGQKLNNRITGADFMLSLSALAEAEQWPIFLLGSMNEHIVEQATWHLRYTYKNIKIVGHASGGVVEFISGKWQTSDSKLIDKINISKAKIIFVGFGCPKQEKWIYQNLDKLPNVKLAMTIGGSLDFIAGERKRATYILRKLGLEWLWRMVTEPTHFKRVWNAITVFLWETFKWRIKIMYSIKDNVAACIVNNRDEVLLIKRADSREVHWQLPQGGVDEGETVEQAVLREIIEETGIKHIQIIGTHPEHHSYEFPSAWHKLLNGYKGKKQTIFYLNYLGDNSDIKLDNREAIDYSWVYIDDVVEIIHEKRKKMAIMAINGYKKLKHGNTK